RLGGLRDLSERRAFDGPVPVGARLEVVEDDVLRAAGADAERIAGGFEVVGQALEPGPRRTQRRLDDRPLVLLPQRLELAARALFILDRVEADLPVAGTLEESGK